MEGVYVSSHVYVSFLSLYDANDGNGKNAKHALYDANADDAYAYDVDANDANDAYAYRYG